MLSTFGINGDFCASESDCLSGICDAGICVDSSKECPNNCTSVDNGQCAFVNSISDNFIEACPSSETFCRAQCLCNDGWFGGDCSLTEAEYATFQQERAALCFALSQTADIQDIGADVITGMANSVASVLIDATQLTDDTLINCTQALIFTIESEPSIAGSASSVYDNIVTALSNALARASSGGLGSFPPALLQSIYGALSTLGVGIQDGKALNEEPNTVTTENVRFLVSLLDSLETTTEISVPQSDYEFFQGVASTSLNFSVSAEETNGAGIDVMQFTNDPRNASSDAAPVSLELTGYFDEISGSRRLTEATAEVTISLINSQELTNYYNETLDGNKTFECEFAIEPYNVTIACPNNETVRHTCNGFGGTFNYICPPRPYREDPQCITFDGAGYSVDPSCTVIEFDDFTTTCRCSGITASSTSSSSDRRLSSASSGQLEFAAQADIVISNFVNNFKSVGSLSFHDFTSNLVIVSIISVILLITFGGLYSFSRIDEVEEKRRETQQLEEKMRVVPINQFINKTLPLEFSGQKWYSILWRKMVLEHDFFCVFLPYDRSRDYRSVRWTYAMGKLINFLFIDTILAYLFFQDDGTCEGYTTENSCLNTPALNRIDHLCVWDPLFKTCTFNEDTGETFLGAVILTTIITTVAMPFDQVFYVLVRQAKRLLARSSGNVEDESVRLADTETLHDLHEHQSLSTTLLRAARLEKMRTKIDGLTVQEEAYTVVKKAVHRDEKDLIRQARTTAYLRKDESIIKRCSSFQEEDLVEYYQRIAERKVAKTRKETEKVLRELDRAKDNDERESVLLKAFFIGTLTKFQRDLASQFMPLRVEKTQNFTNREIRVQILSLVLLVTYILAVSLYIFLFGIAIGPKATNLWLIGAFISLAQEVFILKPFRLWMRSVFIASYGGDHIHVVCGLLRERSVRIMKRKETLMSEYSALIQHFNPACRAARQHPHLAVSRLLMSLNDYDLPADSLKRKKNCFEIFGGNLLLPIVFLVQLTLILLPENIQEGLFETVVVGAVNFTIVAFTVVESVNFAVMIALIVIILAIFAYREITMERQRRRTRSKAILPVEVDIFDDDMKALEKTMPEAATPVDRKGDRHGEFDKKLSHDCEDDPAAETARAKPRDRHSYRQEWFRGLRPRIPHRQKNQPSWATGVSFIEYNLDNKKYKGETFVPSENAVRTVQRETSFSALAEIIQDQTKGGGKAMRATPQGTVSMHSPRSPRYRPTMAWSGDTGDTHEPPAVDANDKTQRKLDGAAAARSQSQEIKMPTYVQAFDFSETATTGAMKGPAIKKATSGPLKTMTMKEIFEDVDSGDSSPISYPLSRPVAQASVPTSAPAGSVPAASVPTASVPTASAPPAQITRSPVAHKYLNFDDHLPPPGKTGAYALSEDIEKPMRAPRKLPPVQIGESPRLKEAPGFDSSAQQSSSTPPALGQQSTKPGVSKQLSKSILSIFEDLALDDDF
jgi:hypothetical protein